MDQVIHYRPGFRQARPQSCSTSVILQIISIFPLIVMNSSSWMFCLYQHILFFIYIAIPWVGIGITIGVCTVCHKRASGSHSTHSAPLRASDGAYHQDLCRFPVEALRCSSAFCYPVRFLVATTVFFSILNLTGSCVSFFNWALLQREEDTLLCLMSVPQLSK